ncbi:MAG TPA: helix-turn-helix domain-containing protein [Candidatus Limnocylindria bacterium]
MTGTLWLTLGEASRMLGVDPDTLRRWADTGKVEVLKTPGGHRRFLRESIEGMLPRPRRSLSAIGEAPDRIAAEFRKRVRSDLATQDWTRHFDETSLRWFRERGMRMSDLLIGHLTAGRPGHHARLEQAAALGREYGVEAKRQGLSLGEATQAFLFFRARFLAEIANVARRRSLDPQPAAVLFAEADRALDVVILALIDGHRATGAA